MSRTNIALILVAAVAGAAAGVGANRLLSAQAAAPEVAAADPSHPTLEARLASIAVGQESMERAVAELRTSIAALEARSARTPLSAPAEVARSSDGDRTASAVVEAPDAALDPRAQIASLLARLGDPDLDEMETQQVWEQARAAGLTDALVEAIEQRAEREPNNPDLRLDLGKAYLQKVFAAGSGPMAGIWATKADKAFDQALELDPQHWEARFQKAVSLSFWPPALGKQGLAISEFETLIAQQNQGPKEAHHAHTYLFLGNMYQQSGSMEKALAAWKQGLDLFPDNQDLKKQIATNKQF